MSPTKGAPSPPTGSAAQDSATGDIAALSYEQAREQLMDVVNKLEAGSASLEDSLALWERGEALAKRCEEWLEGAKARLDAARTADSKTSSEQ
ncbi:exodeoxyribonuclease VII small subunit [Arthrobacter sp. H35-D1]|uniref:exodeoxyribonuclease VII small subunit n=1 Tax=Arthrobacter sp. H35-D1 TaxID=3046202 RepID=UPI0024B96F64|nr:exodeoxyribonuclease VII small subunit [Arthrobacter sp. H35-D1]MDJ0314546.1 exodeoxyribonuclease VII small subunit [Arthrobacter sp. H35-D1]